MAAQITSWPEGRPPHEGFPGELASPRKDSNADMLQLALEKQHQFDRHKTIVEEMRARLDEVCAEIVRHGGNAERLYHVRMLETGLLHARREMEVAGQQLDAAVRQLRRIHDRQPSNAARTAQDGKQA